MIDDRYERELTEARRQALHRELRTGGPVLVPRPVELELGERIAVTPEFLAQQRAELDRLRAQVQAVRRLHQSCQPGPGYHCTSCDEVWPCRTIRALDGEA